MIDVTGAAKYFSASTLSQAWSEYSGKQKEAAIAQAKREFGRALGRPLREDEPPFKDGDQVREEYATYEQAIYTLLRDAQPTGTGTAVPSLDQDDQRAPAHTLAGSKGQWSPRALAWLGKLSVIARRG